MLTALATPPRQSTQHIDFIQISDCHLLKDPTAVFCGIQPSQHLHATIQQLEQCRNFDFILNTGDVAQDACKTTYQHYLQLLQPIQCPHFAIRGNHDNDDFPFDYAKTINWLDLDHWAIILLNSQKDGYTYGEITSHDLQQLQQLLQDFQQYHPKKHLLIALHHHVLPVGSAWLDRHILQNHQHFLEILKPFQQVKLLITGHVHQICESQYQHITIQSCPATSVQFKPQQIEFTLDNQPPAYRHYRLYADGHFSSKIIALDKIYGHIDQQLNQY